MKKAEKLLKQAQQETNNLEQAQEDIKNKKIALAPLCSSIKCEEDLKFKTNGAKILNIKEDQKKPTEKCIICNKQADYIARVGKSY